MAKVMEWNGLNLPAQNFTTSTKGPGDLNATSIVSGGSIQWGRWHVGGDRYDWAIQRADVQGKRSAFEFGALQARGTGNLNSREFQVVFYARFHDVGATTGQRFRFFRAYDSNGKWLASLRFDGRYGVRLYDDTGNYVSLGNITPSNWTRFEVSFNRRSGVIAARQSATSLGSWKRITMNATMKSRPRLDRIAFGSFEADSPRWFQIRNILVNDDSYPVGTLYTPPKSPKINSNITTRRIAQNEPVTFNTTVVQGDAPINGRWWEIEQGGYNPWMPIAIPASTPVGGTYPMEPTSKTYPGGSLEVGQHTVKYTVRDTNNFVVSKTFGLTVGDADSPPEADLVFPAALVGQRSTLQATVVNTGQNSSSITKIEWKMIDGPGEVEIASPNQLTTSVGPFNLPGTYTFELLLTNDKGLSMVFTTSREINLPEPPQASIVTPAEDVVSMFTGESVTFTVAETQGSLPVTSRVWSTTPVGGQITGQGTKSATIKFPVADTYSVSYTANDVLGTTVVAENKIVQVNQAYPPSIIFPPDATINLEKESEVFVSAVVEEGSFPVSSYEWEVVESPENVGATIEYTSDTTITVKDFTENGFYRLQLRVTDSTGINVGIGEFQIYAYAGSATIDPTRPIDPMDWMTNEQLRLKASQRMSGTPDGNTTQIIKRYYQSVVKHPDKYHMSFHQLEREFYKGVAKGEIETDMTILGLISGGGAQREGEQ